MAGTLSNMSIKPSPANLRVFARKCLQSVSGGGRCFGLGPHKVAVLREELIAFPPVSSSGIGHCLPKTPFLLAQEQLVSLVSLYLPKGRPPV